MLERPVWLRVMENGGLGEARARAFLIERFWILERSVDIEGADFLIQRRLSNQNFLDRVPPRLAVVQVKFVQDGGTTISIHKSYVCSTDGKPFTEFFLLIFNGVEDSASAYLLSAQEIIANFSEKASDKGTFLTISASRILGGTNFAILSKKLALDRIETALINAVFMANRRFLFNTNFFNIKLQREHIEPDLSLPVYNSYGDLPDAFLEEKMNVQKTVQEMEEVLEALHEMLRSINPSESFELYDKVVSQYVSNRNLTFSADFFRDGSFAMGLKEHSARLNYLRERGIAGAYTTLVSEYENVVCRRILELGKRYGYLRVEVHFLPNSLLKPRVDASEASVANKPSDEVSPGRILQYINLENLLGQRPSRHYEKDLSALLRERVNWFVSHFQTLLDTLVFDDDFLSELYES